MALDLARIRKSTRRIGKFVKRNSKRPGSDAVHKLRTSVRHLESALTALEPEKPRVKSLLRDLKKVRRLAGRVRDMDVLTASALSVDVRGEQDCMVRLLEHLGAERDRRARELRRALAKRRHRITRALDRAIDRIERVAEKARASEDSTAVRGAVARAIQYSSKLSQPGRLTTKNLHEYRLQVKELRDILRLSGRAADSTVVRKLEDVKAAIGEWHDWLELADIANDVLDHGTSCALSKRLRDTRDEKFRHASSLARALIAYLRPKTRKSKSRTAPIAKPVLDAAAAIASGSDLAH